MVKPISRTLIALLLAAFTSYAQTNGKLKLNDLVQEALLNNPQLRGAKNQSLAISKRINQVKAWEAPQVALEFFQTPISAFPNPITKGMETDYSVQQSFPFPGKRSSMGEAATYNANMYESQANALARKIIRDVKSTYYELYLVHMKIQLNKENQELLRKFIEIASKQYEVGMGKQPDIIRAQTELSTLINEGINLDKERISIEAMINTLLSRPANAPLAETEEIFENIPKWTYDQISKLSYDYRNELNAMKFNIEMNKAELKVSKLEYFPDIMGKLTYKNMSGTKDDFFSAMIGVNIPLALWSQDKYTYKVEENELNIKTAQDLLGSMKNMVSFDVQSALVKIESNRNLVELYKNTVIPQSEQTLDVTVAAYQTGKTEFLMLIDAYRTVLMSKLNYYMSVMNFMSSQAALEQAVGLSISEIKEKIQ
jgi:outer membrane protein TolC